MTEQPSSSLFSKLTWQSVFMIGLMLSLMIIEMDMSVGGAAGNPIESNACDGTFRVQFGRCETNTISFTTNAAGGFASQTVTFSPPFTNTPSMTWIPTVLGAASVLTWSSYSFLSEEPALVPQPIIFDTSALVGDTSFTTNPFSFTITITPGSPNEYAVLIVAHASGQENVNCFTATTSTVSSIADTQSSQWHREQSGNAAQLGCGYLALWTAKLLSASSDTITVNYANPNLETDNAGAIVSLYKGVAGIGPSAFSTTVNPTGNVSIITSRPNDILVGGSELSEEGLPCQAISAGSGQTQRRVDSVNCGVNGITNYDLQDKPVPIPGTAIFKEIYTAAADSTAIAAVELITEYAPFWTLTGSFAEMFSNSGLPCGISCTDHEISGISIVAPNGIPVEFFAFSCTSASSPAASLSFEITNNGVAFGNMITGTASTLCNGTTQTSALFNVAANLFGPFALKGQCTASCGNGLNIELSQAYLVFRVTQQVAWVLAITTTTPTSFISSPRPASGNPSSTTVTFQWTATSYNG